ncbi:hypothetical protein OK074_6877 [Actinobacteria bacterium OK074]|nr:hypothetical protein OK074_6877 [Actinobacteria bacterium OK074]
MSGLELILWLLMAYIVGRVHQWRKDRRANEVGRHISKAIEAMQDKKGK